jgi:hypothetical protein
VTCADLIRGNPKLQEGFANLQVTSVLGDDPSGPEINAGRNGYPKVYVIDGLLDLMLSVSSLQAFDLRLAACECMKAYFHCHPVIRRHFLRRAINGHLSGADETANVLTTLLRPSNTIGSLDPYRHWLASVLLLHLIFEDGEAKSLAMSVAEGDAEKGEEVVTCIQNISANLIAALERDEDERVLVAYLMLLCGWLFEDPDAVNDFLGEGSNVQSLLQAVIKTNGDKIVVQGLCAMLLGIVYEFSTKDSPIPRATLHSLLTSGMGRDQYIDRITRFRGHPLIRDFEVLPQRLDSTPDGVLPDVFFDQLFVDFAKDNFSRLIRAIDRDPGYEIPVIANGIQKGISREMVDSLREKLAETEKLLEKAETDLGSLDRRLAQEQADHKKAQEAANLDLARIKNVNKGLQNHHEEDMKKLQMEHDKKIQDFQRQLQHVQRAAEGEAERLRRRAEAEISDLKASNSKIKSELSEAIDNHARLLQACREEASAELSTQKSLTEQVVKKADDAEQKAKQYEVKAAENEKLAVIFESKAKESEEKLKENEERLKEYTKSLKDAEEKLHVVEERAKESDKKLVAAEKRAKENGEKLKAAEKRAKDTEERVKVAEKLAKDIEERLKAAEKRANASEEKVKAADKKSGDGQDKKIKAAQEKLQKVGTINLP